jgi:hypothetical protein
MVFGLMLSPNYPGPSSSYLAASSHGDQSQIVTFSSSSSEDQAQTDCRAAPLYRLFRRLVGLAPWDCSRMFSSALNP